LFEKIRNLKVDSKLITKTYINRIYKDIATFKTVPRPLYDLIQYHPLSRTEREQGLSLDEAGRRKFERTRGGEYEDYHVLHIPKLADLLHAFAEHCFIAPRITQHLDESLLREQFLRDLSEARLYGHDINERIAEARM
jgi:hypothetical protein